MPLTPREQETFERQLAEAQAEFGAGPMRRVEEAIRAATGRGEAVAPPDPLQKPGSLYLRGLTTRAWWDPAAVPEVATLERSAGVFREELGQLLEDRVGFQHFDEGPEGFEAEETSFGWNAFYFRWSCRDVPENRARCPRSSRVLESLPNLAQQAWFSALKPGTHIGAHCGPINAVLTVHLALIVPPGCEMRVGRETRTWQEGRCLVFDDSLSHEVWHRGSETRFILLLDVWHPEITPAERDFFRRSIRALEEANERAGVASAVDRYRGALDGQSWWQ